MNIEIENPGALINLLQRQVEELQSQIRFLEGRLASEQTKPIDHGPALKRLRLHRVMTLYIGDGGREQLRQSLVDHGPELVHLEDSIWCLENAPVSEQAKQEFRMLAKTGMERF